MPAGVPRRRTKNLAEREIARWNRQRTETQKQLAEKYRLENAVRRAELLDRAQLEKSFTELADALLGVVMASDFSRTAKEDFAKNLSSWPLILENTARAQSRLAHQEKKGSAAEVEP
jgi:hypothetical protein